MQRDGEVIVITFSPIRDPTQVVRGSGDGGGVNPRSLIHGRVRGRNSDTKKDYSHAVRCERLMNPAEDQDPGQENVPGRPGVRDWIMKYVGILSALLLMTGCILASPFIDPPFILSILVIAFSGILYLIRGTRALSISIIVLAILYGLNWLPLLIFVTTLGIVAVGELAYRASAGGHHRYLTYLAASSAGGALAMLYLGHRDPLLLLLGVVVAVLLKSALKDRNDLLTVEGLGVAMTMFLFEDLHFQVQNQALLAAVIFAFSFGYFAYRF
jgi:hypothetical protein